MGANVKSKTSDLAMALAGSCSLAVMSCSTKEEAERTKVFLKADIKKFASDYASNPRHISRMNKINELADKFVDILYESEQDND